MKRSSETEDAFLFELRYQISHHREPLPLVT